MHQTWKALINNKESFSLIETITAIALFVLIATISLLCLNFYKQQILSSEVKKLAMNMILLQQQAIGENNDLVLTIDIQNNSYFTNLEYPEFLNNNIQFGYIEKSYGPPSNPTSLINSPCTFKKNNIKFEKNGNINAGTIYLIDKSKNFMYAITTGVAKKIYIRAYKYNSPKWVNLN